MKCVRNCYYGNLNCHWKSVIQVGVLGESKGVWFVDARMPTSGFTYTLHVVNTSLIRLWQLATMNFLRNIALKFEKMNWTYQCRARNNFRIVSGHDDRPNSFLLGYDRFWPVKCIWCITLLGAHKPKMKNWKLLTKLEIFGNFVTGSGRIPMSVSMREL